jgi:peptide/nickel transport system substrate-binding protein
MHTNRTLIQVAIVLPLLATACSGSGDSSEAQGTEQGPHRGGTLTVLMPDRLYHLDPQRIWTGEELAFAGSYLHRTLNSYRLDRSGVTSRQLVPDLATGTGTPNQDATSWSWTLRHGIAWEDGSPITCADVKYGVSRTFATDVITEGPTFAMSMLDVPTADNGESVYKGPYVTAGNDVAAFDRAVSCRGDEITFHLGRPVPDFDHTVTLLAFGPVPEPADTGEKYDTRPMSSGPYQIAEATDTQLVLERNEHWSTTTDAVRGAYPDAVVVRFGIDQSVIDERMMSDSGEDRSSVPTSQVQPSSLSRVFGDTDFSPRRVNQLDPFVHYLVVNTERVPALDHRRAIATALDRAQIRTTLGGRFAGDLADGVIKPNLPQDYEPSGLWEGLLGVPVPDGGDQERAAGLMDGSGAKLHPLRYDYERTRVNDQVAAAVVKSLAGAGIEVQPNPIEGDQFLGVIFDPASEADLVLISWGPDWANASTVIPALFTRAGGFDLSHVDDPAFSAKVDAALVTTDRSAQADRWKALNKAAMSQVWVVPLIFSRRQRLAGSEVRAASGRDGQVYLWPSYGSWPYGDLYLAK